MKKWLLKLQQAFKYHWLKAKYTGGQCTWCQERYYLNQFKEKTKIKGTW